MKIIGTDHFGLKHTLQFLNPEKLHKWAEAMLEKAKIDPEVTRPKGKSRKKHALEIVLSDFSTWRIGK